MAKYTIVDKLNGVPPVYKNMYNEKNKKIGGNE